ncbi:MAG: Ig-like domain-containing protein [Chthoniobacterales bacterium]
MPHRYCNRVRGCLGFAAAALTFAGFASFANASNLKFAWNATSDPNVVGYNLSYGTTSGRYTKTINAGAASSTTVSLTPGSTYYFVVTAYNSIGMQSLPSNEVSLSVANVPPSVSLTSPTAGASLNGTSPIGLTATAADSDGTIVKVEFYEGTTKIGESTSSPYAATWNNAPSGNFTLSALAYDDSGAAVRSSGVQVAVNGTSPAPSATPTAADKVRVIAMTPIVKAGAMARFKVVATQTPTQDLVVNYAMGGTATGGVQYSMTGMGGHATVPQGKRSVLVQMQTLTVPGAKGGKTLIMTVLPGTGYVPGRGNAIVRILSH